MPGSNINQITQQIRLKINFITLTPLQAGQCSHTLAGHCLPVHSHSHASLIRNHRVMKLKLDATTSLLLLLDSMSTAYVVLWKGDANMGCLCIRNIDTNTLSFTEFSDCWKWVTLNDLEDPSELETLHKFSKRPRHTAHQNLLLLINSNLPSLCLMQCGPGWPVHCRPLPSVLHTRFSVAFRQLQQGLRTILTPAGYWRTFHVRHSIPMNPCQDAQTGAGQAMHAGLFNDMQGSEWQPRWGEAGQSSWMRATREPIIMHLLLLLFISKTYHISFYILIK